MIKLKRKRNRNKNMKWMMIYLKEIKSYG